MKPVMLVLSTFRQSEKAIETALEKSAQGKKLVVVFIVDVNLARYLIGTDIGAYPHLMERCEKDVLKENHEDAKKKVREIVNKAGEKGVQANDYVRIGRFAPETLKIIEQEKPGVVVTTRSDRPAWVKKFFGAPVDDVIENAGCEVVEA